MVLFWLALFSINIYIYIFFAGDNIPFLSELSGGRTQSHGFGKPSDARIPVGMKL